MEYSINEALLEEKKKSCLTNLLRSPLLDGKTTVDFDFEIKDYQEGKIILNENEKLSSVGFVLEGSVEISSFDINGNKIRHRKIVKNESFGLNFVFYLNSIYNIMASSDCKIMFIDKKTIESDLTMLKNIVSILAKESLEFEGKLLHITRKTTKEKLMSFLLEQAKISGKLTFKINMNRWELAEYLGVERSAMCNELSKLAKEGLLTYSKYKFTLL